MNQAAPPLNALATALFDIGAVKIGKFKLHSGRRSPIYLDLRLLVSYPDVLRMATRAYRACLDKIEFDLLAATPLAGLPIGTALCLDMNRPLIYPRKTAKSYGTGKEVEGHWSVGQTAVIIDDLVTSGDSILQAAVSLKKSGLDVRHVVVLVDREQGGKEMLQSQGYQLQAVMTLRHLLALLEDADRISARQHTRVLNSL